MAEMMIERVSTSTRHNISPKRYGYVFVLQPAAMKAATGDKQ